MTLAVIDASALTAFYISDDSRRADVSTRLVAGDALFAPAHLDIEVFSALRGLARGGKAVEEAGPAALAHLAAFPIRRMPTAPLMERMWELRANVTGYDAAYVALAERLDCVLITCDTKLAAATGPRCRIDVIS
jgi:predicted nucleic acid-binding protein